MAHNNGQFESKSCKGSGSDRDLMPHNLRAISDRDRDSNDDHSRSPLHHIKSSSPPITGGMGNERGGARDRTDVCRDFMKNICNRGSRCKYYHPQDVQQTQYQDDVKFCIDFQNRGCSRDNCRYVHAYREDADRYKRSGEVNLSLARAIAAITAKDSINGIPFCKEFQTGNCSRGNNRCRYWHIVPSEERERRRVDNYGSGGGGRGGSGVVSDNRDHQQSGRGSGSGSAAPFCRDFPYQTGDATGGRSSGTEGYDYDAFVDPIMGAGSKRSRYDTMDIPCQSPTPSNRYVTELERKNQELIKENEQLKREVQRERERYEDLYALFRSQQQAQAAAATALAAQQTQQVSQPPAPTPQQQTYGPTRLDPYGAPPEIVSSLGAAPSSLVSSQRPSSVRINSVDMQLTLRTWNNVESQSMCNLSDTRNLDECYDPTQDKNEYEDTVFIDATASDNNITLTPQTARSDASNSPELEVFFGPITSRELKARAALNDISKKYLETVKQILSFDHDSEEDDSFATCCSQEEYPVDYWSKDNNEKKSDMNELYYNSADFKVGWRALSSDSEEETCTIETTEQLCAKLFPVRNGVE